MDKLTPKQKAFADYYIECGNATEAAKRAGYSEKTARQIGTENLSKPSILEYIQDRTTPTEQKRIASGDEVLQFFTRVMDGKEKDAFGLEVSISDRLAAGREILKRNINDRKLEIELLKLENQIKDDNPEEETEDNFLDALNASAAKVWADSEESESEQ